MKTTKGMFWANHFSGLFLSALLFRSYVINQPVFQNIHICVVLFNELNMVRFFSTYDHMSSCKKKFKKIRKYLRFSGHTMYRMLDAVIHSVINESNTGFFIIAIYLKYF